MKSIFLPSIDLIVNISAKTIDFFSQIDYNNIGKNPIGEGYDI